MLDKNHTIHLIGIGGIGVSAVARLLLGYGYRVQGSDVRESSLTSALVNEGASVVIGHDPSHIDGADLVVVSTAIPKDNVEYLEAQRRGVPIVHRSEILNELVSRKRVIGVTGTHGKGTVSSMITTILDVAGWSPGFVIGGYLHNFGTNARAGKGDWIVVEVDESDGSHCNYDLEYAVCNFLEVDHLNYYKDHAEIIETMRDFFNQSSHLKRVFLNGDCDGNREMIKGLEKPYITYGTESSVDFKGSLVNKKQFPIRFAVPEMGEFELNLPGRYNVVNAMAAIALTTELGVDPDTIRRGLAVFQGLENRFTIRQAGPYTIVKDYISHPTGMRKVIESAKDLGNGKIYAVFKPYRYSLINYLKDEYGAAFQGCDHVVISKMYAAEEDPIPGVDTMTVVEKIRENGLEVTYIEDQNEIPAFLETLIQEGDQIIFFGGDDYFVMADKWGDKLTEKVNNQ